MPETIAAPFTQEQVRRLRLWQACDWVHPLTHCNHETMNVSNAGLTCPKCGHVQTWAPACCFQSLPPHPRLFWVTENRDWEVRCYYAEDVKPPHTPFALAYHVWQIGDHTKDEDVSIAVNREDIGIVEVRRVDNGVPQEWTTVKPAPTHG